MYGGSSHTKLIENSYGQLIISSQPTVIYDNIKVNHPLIKLLHEYVKKMDVVGDGASFFVMVVSELLTETMFIIDRGIKPALLANSLREIYKELDNISSGLKIQHKIDFNDKESVSKVIRGTVKDIKLEKFIVEGISQTQSFDAEKIRVCKVACGSVEDSYVVEGMVLNRFPEGEVKHVNKATTSIYNCPLDVSRTELKGTVLMRTAEDLLSFSKEENKNIKEVVESIDADVIICSGKVEKVYLDFLNKARKLVFKVVSKHDLRRIRELVGGSISSVLSPQKRGSMGLVDEVTTFIEGDIKYTRFICKNKKIYTLVLKNYVQAMLDEQERIIQKALTVLDKNTTLNNIELVEGAGKFERQLSKSFLSGYDNSVDEKHLAYKCMGKALKTFKVEDVEVYDVYSIKLKALKYATEFIAILFETSDYLIGKPEPMNISPRTNQNWDEDDH